MGKHQKSTTKAVIPEEGEKQPTLPLSVMGWGLCCSEES